jgi:integrase
MAQKRRRRRVAGSIRRLPSGRYQARFRDVDGRLRSAPTTFATKGQADLWLATIAADMSRGEWVDPSAGKVPLDVYAVQWMDAKSSIAPKTVELYKYLLDDLIMPSLGDLPLNAITPMAVRQWRANLSKAGRPGASTIAKAYRLLSSILRTAVIDNLIVRNPCVEKGAGVERVKEIRAPTPEQVARLADAIAPRYRALVLTAAYAGCRWGELTELRQRNLDVLHGWLTVVDQAVELGNGERIVRPPKTDAGRRVVHLPANLVEVLEWHLAQFLEPDPLGLVLTTESGSPLRQRNFRNREWMQAVRAAGVEGLRFHDLRHFAGTLATISGATIREVQGRLGHASPAAAYRYQQVLDDRDAEIATRLDAVMRNADVAQRQSGRSVVRPIVNSESKARARSSTSGGGARSG